MPKGGLVMIKDLIGWRVAHYLQYDGIQFTMDDGVRLSANVFLATMPNVTAMMSGRSPDPVGQQMYWPLTAPQLVEYLDGQGHGVDSDLRIKRKLGMPFMAIKPGQVPLMVALHLEMCTKRKKEPEREPLALIMEEDKLLQVVAYPHESGGKLVAMAIPEDTDNPGRITTTNNGRILCLSAGDYHLIPKTADVLTLHKMIQVEDGPESLDELTKSNRFVSTDGQICRNGLTSLEASSLSIDQFR